MNYIEEKIYSKAFEDGVNYAIQKMFAEEEDKKTNNRGLGKAIGIGSGLAVANHALEFPIHAIADYGKEGLKDLADKENLKEIAKEQFATRSGITRLAGKLGAGVGIAAAGYKIGKNNKNKKENKGSD